MHLLVSKFQTALDDYQALMRYPGPHRENLLALADELKSQGIVGALSHFALVEMANAAYLHAVEELLGDYVQRNGIYAVLDESGRKVGDLSGYRLYFGNAFENKNYSFMLFRTSGRFALADTTMHASIGWLQHRTLHMLDGRQYHILETGRRIAGDVHPISDCPH